MQQLSVEDEHQLACVESPRTAQEQDCIAWVPVDTEHIAVGPQILMVHSIKQLESVPRCLVSVHTGVTQNLGKSMIAVRR